MRSIEEQRVAFDCLKLADNQHARAEVVTERAAAFFAFVTGQDVDDAKRKLDAVREVITTSV